MANTGQPKKKPWKQRGVKKSDNLVPVPGAKDTDVIIAVLGPTGAGKSTFINIAAGKAAAPVGMELESCTSAVRPIIVPHPTGSHRIIFVDTPGFDDTYVDDTEILRRIAVWMAYSYDKNMTLAGVIYLHEISQTRMSGTSHRNFGVFNRLTGDKAARVVVLATTKWSEVVDDVGRRREQQLAVTHWKSMLGQGSRMCQFRDTHESAWEIVDVILTGSVTERTPGRIEAILIQEELVNFQKCIPMTEAGNALRTALQELLKEQKELAGTLKKDSKENGELRKRYEEVETQLRSTLDQIQGLQVSLGARIRAIFNS